MAYILSIETATNVCSVALSKDNDIITFKESNDEKSHSSLLTIFIAELIKEAGLKIDDLAAVAISSGPGSYTGLRIGVSVAKGICYGLNIPLISVDTLFSMAMSFLNENKNLNEKSILCPMIDARRMEVYNQLININSEIIRKTQSEIIDHKSFEFFSDYKIHTFGSGAEKCKEVLFSNNVSIYSNFNNSATYLSSIAYEKYKLSEFENIAYYEPFYLKDFIAKPAKDLLK